MKLLRAFVLAMLTTISAATPTLAETFQKSSSHSSAVEGIGLIAGCGTTFAALPDFITMLKRRSTKGFNPRMAAITGIFQVIWVVYGYLIAAPAVITWNVIGVTTNATTVIAYIHFNNVQKASQKTTFKQ
ncbi:SemiSWEET family sugar transporter [Aetokthonos hydrillicola]|jgi:MtN3 and saliva related transmembrane protein|uniref:SemiSWEET family sugar transporter n=1 Tax=Aetokthonos hydrillicola TaxID=1550245 RepID=UPI001ABA24D1|nr:SemiSWEET family transporter [Aetokthonos hydrillicola]MBO3459691.1 hypothetical protein [Aetokthonos hydrillicola CCALA 1050]MBW4588541.1 hypothetical protein [Aetokthonos hydrillicola CCALA 1050]